MKITSLVENTSTVGFPVEHGLSLYIQLDDGKNILFDMGQGSHSHEHGKALFATNAERLGVSIADVDIAVISHGHYDHGGGLRTFLELNDKAKVYIHQDAFQPHYSLRENGLAYIGIDCDLSDSDRLAICDDHRKIDDRMTLFAGVHGCCCCPSGNRLLFGPNKTDNDNFSHEQNLIIEENGMVVLFAGCAHNGIVNIIRKAVEIYGKAPSYVFAGMHLVKSGLSPEEEEAFIVSLTHELMSFRDCRFFTMHCTGAEQYQKLKTIMGAQIDYLSCGESFVAVGNPSRNIKQI